MEIKISQEWLDSRPTSPTESSIAAGSMMMLNELDARGEELFREFVGQVPATEIRRRGWLDSYLDSTAKMTTDTILDAFSNFILARPPTLATQAMFRRSNEVAQGSLWRGLTSHLWLAHTAATAIEVKIPVFQPEALEGDSITELVQLSRFEDGPARARGWLKNAGIHLSVNNTLPTMRLDGAAMMLQDNRPLIALTLRYDRLDNFWFTLLHEIAHIKRHIIKDTNLAFLDDLEAPNAGDEREAEADAFARNSAIPRDVWRRSEAHRHRTKKAVLELADQLQIHPAIIAGRLRYEAKDYTLLSELIGQDQVREYLIG